MGFLWQVRERFLWPSPSPTTFARGEEGEACRIEGFGGQRAGNIRKYVFFWFSHQHPWNVRDKVEQRQFYTTCLSHVAEDLVFAGIHEVGAETWNSELQFQPWESLSPCHQAVENVQHPTKAAAVPAAEAVTQTEVGINSGWVQSEMLGILRLRRSKNHP